MHIKAIRKHLKEHGYLGGVHNNRVNETKQFFSPSLILFFVFILSEMGVGLSVAELMRVLAVVWFYNPANILDYRWAVS